MNKTSYIAYNSKKTILIACIAIGISLLFLFLVGILLFSKSLIVQTVAGIGVILCLFRLLFGEKDFNFSLFKGEVSVKENKAKKKK